MRVFRNAYHDEQLARAVGLKLLGTAAVKSPVLAYRTGKLAMKVSFMMVLTALWNALLFGDEEDELPEDVKKRVHIIFGRNDKGEVVYFDRLGTLEDFAGWFGMDDITYDVRDFLNGEKTFLELVGMNSTKIVNKGVQTIHPIAKTATEQAFGMKLFPDFTNPTVIHDRVEHLMGLVSMQKVYASTRDKVIGRPHDSFKVRSLLAYSIEPEETNYYNVRDKVDKAAEEFLGKEKTSMIGKRSEKSEFLYEIKVGLRFGDRDYAEKFLDKYVAAGGNDRGLKQSLSSLNPLHSIPQDLRDEYFDSLNGEEQKKVERAYEYYREVLLDGFELD
jgi:hypothetical protein